MGVFSSGGVGIDLGSANVTIFLESEGVVLREPSYVLAARDDPDNVLACGRDARQMLGRTPQAAMLFSPVMDGAVGDIDMATTLFRELSEKAIGRRRALDRTRVVVSMGLGVTRVERAALEEDLEAIRARAYPRGVRYDTPRVQSSPDPDGLLVKVADAIQRRTARTKRATDALEERQRQIENVHEAILTMDAKSKIILLTLYYPRRTYAQAAELLDMDVSTVSRQRKTAVDRLVRKYIRLHGNIE